jgi:hypothetical protein
LARKRKGEMSSTFSPQNRFSLLFNKYSIADFFLGKRPQIACHYHARRTRKEKKLILINNFKS